MKYRGILVNEGFNKLDVFNDESEIRDDCLYFLRQIKKKFLYHDILFVQPDSLGKDEPVDFEIDFEIPKTNNQKAANKYLVRFECDLIYPKSYNKSYIAKYRKVFSWNDKATRTNQFVKINIPNKILLLSNPACSERTKLCCVIAGNKAVLKPSSLELYSERVKTIRWFEQNAPESIDLLGSGWDAPAARQGLAGKVIGKLQPYLLKRSGRVFFPSYRGKVASKLDTLRKYRFSICYENVRDLPGYITEKIFDSFFVGCVPVYWGAANISTYIPEDCFIDRRKFTSHEELYKFMVSMTEPEYTDYQERIAAFLASDRVKPFSAETFAETIVNTIVSDLGISA